MQALKDRIEKEGQVLAGSILKVDGFMNHRIDPVLLEEVGKEFAQCFRETRPTLVLTAETSGIAPALATSIALKVPLVFARKGKPITMAAHAYHETAPSHTRGGIVDLVVSAEYLRRSDRVLIIDDFLSTAKTICALVRLVKQSGAELVGVGAVIEKIFEGGRNVLQELTVPVVSLAAIERFDNGKIIFQEATVNGKRAP